MALLCLRCWGVEARRALRATISSVLGREPAAMRVMVEAVKLSVTALDLAEGSCQHAVSQDLQGLQSSAVFFCTSPIFAATVIAVGVLSVANWAQLVQSGRTSHSGR